jgi:hypothetical protein
MADGEGRPPGLRLRIFKVTEWLIPGVILALLPKCPLCIVAYVAVGTGIGLSVSTAANIRILLILACFGSLVYLSTRLFRRIYLSRIGVGGTGSDGSSSGS